VEDLSTSAYSPSARPRSLGRWARDLHVSVKALRAFLLTNGLRGDDGDHDLFTEESLRAALRLAPHEKLLPGLWAGHYTLTRMCLAEPETWESMLHLRRGSLLPALTEVGASPTHALERDSGRFYHEDAVVRAVSTVLRLELLRVPEGDRLFFSPKGILCGTWGAWMSSIHELATAPSNLSGVLVPGRGRLALTDGSLARFVWIHRERDARAVIRMTLTPPSVE